MSSRVSRSNSLVIASHRREMLLGAGHTQYNTQEYNTQYVSYKIQGGIPHIVADMENLKLDVDTQQTYHGMYVLPMMWGEAWAHRHAHYTSTLLVELVIGDAFFDNGLSHRRPPLALLR